MITEDIARFHCLEDPLRFVLPIAAWIGELKRQRFAVLDHRIAKLLSDIVQDEEGLGLTAFLPVIEDRLGKDAWSVLVAACQDLLDDESHSAIEIAYVWTRDPVSPWSAERLSSTKIRIRGPLLDFPVSNVEVWNKHSQVLWSEELETFKH